MAQAQADAVHVPPNSSAFTILTLYLRARRAVLQAITSLCVDPNHPDIAEILKHFAHFAQIYGGSDSVDILNNFMAQITEGARSRKVRVDALILYGIRCALAAQAKITD